MKTPRLLIAAAWAFIPLFAQAQTGSNPKPIILDLGDDRSLQNFGPGEQDGRNWIALIPKEPGLFDLRSLTTRQPADNTRVVLTRPVQTFPSITEPSRFMVSRLGLTFSRDGKLDVLEYTTTPPPGLMNGELLRVKDRTSPNGGQFNFVLDNGPVTVWDPTAAPIIPNGQGNRLLINPATVTSDETGYWRRKTTRVEDNTFVWPLNNNDSQPWLLPNAGGRSLLANGGSAPDLRDPRNWFRLPGTGTNPFGFEPPKPVTIYPKMSGYKYDPARHMLISPEGLEVEVTEAQVPGRFVLGPAIITPGTRLNGITLVNARDNREVKPERPAPPKQTVTARRDVPTYGDWKDRATKLTVWRDVETTGSPSVRYHCFHPGLVDGASLKDTIKASRARNDNSYVPCVTWSAAPGDRAEDGEGDGANKFKYRKIETTVALDLDQDKLVVIGQGAAVIEAREASFDLGAFSGADMVMVVEKLPPPVSENWKDIVTPLTQWRRMEIQDAAKTSIYCWIGMLSKQEESVFDSIQKSKIWGIKTCVQWKAPEPDDVATEGGVKYKTREIIGVTWINIEKDTKKVVTQRGKIEVIQKPMDSLAPATAVKVLSKPAAAAPAAGLSPKELKWLTTAQRNAYTKAGIFTQAAAAAYRQMIAKNLEPYAKPQGATADYGALAGKAASSAKELDDALPAEVWGGDPKGAVVAESGANKDVQLTPDEFKTLSGDPKYAAALSAYKQARGGADGNVSSTDKPEFSADAYDPIALHLATMEARAALPKPEEPKPEETPLEPLSEEQINTLLSAKEAADYRALVKNATDAKGVLNKNDKNLQAELRRLKPLMTDAAGKPLRTPYKAPGTLDAFNSMPEWQKDKFCDAVKNGRQAAAADPATLGFDLNATNLDDVKKGKREQFLAQQEAIQSENAAVKADWAKGACAQWAAAAGGGGGTTPAGGSGGKDKPNIAPPTPGADKETVDKKKFDYFGKDLMLGALKGALLGLLIGSLFGPVGLIMGPMIGAALYWGAAVDAKRKEGDS